MEPQPGQMFGLMWAGTCPCTGTGNPHAGQLSGWFCALSSGFAFTNEVSINQTLPSLDVDVGGGGDLVAQLCLTLCDPWSI